MSKTNTTTIEDSRRACPLGSGLLPSMLALFGFQISGEVIVKLLELPLPGPLAGMLLLLIWLQSVSGPSVQLRSTGSRLLEHMGLLFVPAGVAVVAARDVLFNDAIPIAACLIISTGIALVVTGWVVSIAVWWPSQRRETIQPASMSP